jgi:hypothetical protein
MAKQFNSTNNKFFVLDGNVAARNGSVSFRTYTDTTGALAKLYPQLAEKGVLGVGVGVQYIEGKDDKGQPRGKFFELSQSHRTFVVRNGQRDINGISMYDFLKNSPFCADSPNLTAGRPLFKELNSAQDAQIAIDAGRNRVKATAKVYELIDTNDEQAISELAAYIGVYDEPFEIAGHRVAEWAEKRPDDFFEIFNSADRAIRALIRKAIQDGVLRLKGSVIHWEDTIIGSDEDRAVQTLLSNKGMADALKERFETKAGMKAEAKAETKAEVKAETKVDPKWKLKPTK